MVIGIITMKTAQWRFLNGLLPVPTGSIWTAKGAWERIYGLQPLKAAGAFAATVIAHGIFSPK